MSFIQVTQNLHRELVDLDTKYIIFQNETSVIRPHSRELLIAVFQVCSKQTVGQQYRDENRNQFFNNLTERNSS